MRLINATTLRMKEFTGTVPPYAILSHTWGEDEVSYDDFMREAAASQLGFRKIQSCCKQAILDGLNYVVGTLSQPAFLLSP
jgi:hypothetical protein